VEFLALEFPSLDFRELSERRTRLTESHPPIPGRKPELSDMRFSDPLVDSLVKVNRFKHIPLRDVDKRILNFN
jgi:hypothetical protein